MPEKTRNQDSGPPQQATFHIDSFIGRAAFALALVLALVQAINYMTSDSRDIDAILTQLAAQSAVMERMDRELAEMSIRLEYLERESQQTPAGSHESLPPLTPSVTPTPLPITYSGTAGVISDNLRGSITYCPDDDGQYQPFDPSIFTISVVLPLHKSGDIPCGTILRLFTEAADGRVLQIDAPVSDLFPPLPNYSPSSPTSRIFALSSAAAAVLEIVDTGPITARVIERPPPEDDK